MATVRSRVLLFLKGMAMGTADLVPGVSGGTIALIARVYDELLASILAVNRHTAALLFSEGPASAWRALNGSFLLTLGSGLLTALLLFGNLVVYLLETRYSYLMCFFSGLIAASLWFLGGQVRQWTPLRLFLLPAGIAIGVGIALLPQFSGSDNLLYYFFCGMLAICAMLLPGISGASILLLLGAYEPVLRALTELDVRIIPVFVLGCLLGLLGFSRVLSWLLWNWRQSTLALLLGVLAGSLYSLWPWRQVLTDAAGVQRPVNLPPMAVDVLTGEALSPLLCAALLIGACILLLALETLGRKLGVKSNSSTA